MYAIVLIVLGLVVSPILAQKEIFDGPCPSSQVEVVENLDHQKFQGYWFILYRYEKSEWMDCVNLTHSWNNSSRTFDVKQNQKILDSGSQMTTYWSIEEKDDLSDNGRFKQLWSDYYIVDTDYKNYAVLWTCLEKGDVNEQNLMVLFRGNFELSSLKNLFATLVKPPFEMKKLKHIEQLDERCYKMG